MALKSFIFLLIFTFSISSHAQENTFLWEISGNKLKKPSYLYGTIHLQDARVFEFSDSVITTFEQCKAFALEIKLDLSDPMKLIDLLIEKDSTKWLRNVMSPDDYEKVMFFIEDNLTFEEAFLMDRMPLYQVAVTLSTAKLKKDRALPMDMDFQIKAMESGKEVIGLEDPEDQIQWLTKIPLDLCQKWILETIDNFDTVDSILDKMIVAYQNQNVRELLKVFEVSQSLESDSRLKEWNQEMMIQRNAKMLQGILMESKKQSTFFAIGAAHLFGEEGLIELLKKEGYRLRPVQPAKSSP